MVLGKQLAFYKGLYLRTYVVFVVVSHFQSGTGKMFKEHSRSG
jgi:hypothetical protein